MCGILSLLNAFSGTSAVPVSLSLAICLIIEIGPLFRAQSIPLFARKFSMLNRRSPVRSKLRPDAPQEEKQPRVVA